MSLLDGVSIWLRDNMPYKDKGKQLAAQHRWIKRNREKTNVSQNRCRIAKLHHPVAMECSVSECVTIGERHHPDPDIYEEIIWLCKQHHENEHHKVERKCTATGCNEKHEAKGFCKLHYSRNKRQEDKNWGR